MRQRPPSGDGVDQREGGDMSRERRSTSVMSKRISSIVEDIIIPLSEHIDKLPTYTSFTVTEYDLCRDIFYTMCRECPSIVHTSRKKFLETMYAIYTEEIGGDEEHPLQ